MFDEGMTTLQVCIFNFIHCCRCIRRCLGFDIQYYFQYFNTNVYCMFIWIQKSALLVLFPIACHFIFFSFIGIHYSEDLMKCRETEIIKNCIIVQITIHFTDWEHLIPLPLGGTGYSSEIISSFSTLQSYIKPFVICFSEIIREKQCDILI